MKNLVGRAQKIIDSYDNLPNTEIIQESLRTELANLIVTDIMELNECIEDFDFKDFFNKVDLKNWE